MQRRKHKHQERRRRALVRLEGRINASKKPPTEKQLEELASLRQSLQIVPTY